MKKGERFLAVVMDDVDPKTIKSQRSFNNVIVRRRSYAVEVDFHSENPQESRTFLDSYTRTLEFRKLSEEGKAYDDAYFKSLLAHKNEIIEEARGMFRDERYWEAHTVLEDIWKGSYGIQKRLLQASIIIAASMTHFQMDEVSTAHSMYNKALEMIRKALGKDPQEYGLPKDFKYPVKLPDIF